jgi:L-threonine kinase
MLGDVYFLVTCPIDFFARARVELYADGPGVEAPADCPKAAAALSATLAHLGRAELRARLAINSPIPRGKGMGSSSADVLATIAATGLALGFDLPPSVMAEIAVSVEPTDGVMFPGIALVDHREARIAEILGPPPPMEIVALDFGGTVDTLEFNRVDRRSAWHSIEAETTEALRLVRLGVKQGHPALVGKGATISAKASQGILPKPMFQAVLEFAEAVGAVGVDVGHSGTIIGVLLDARERRGLSVFSRARHAFPEAEVVHHFQLLGGGLQPV